MLSHQCLTSKSTTRTKDSPKQYKGQVKDRSRHGIKKELRNGDLTSFLSLMLGDPYGNRTHDSAVKGRCLDLLTNGPMDSGSRI